MSASLARRITVGMAALAALLVVIAGDSATALNLTGKEAWALWTCLLALGLIGASWRTPWDRSGRIAALLVVGFGAQLCLIQPGWRPEIAVTSLTDVERAAWIVVAMQSLVAAALAIREGPRLWPTLRKLGLWRCAILGLVAIGLAHGGPDLEQSSPSFGGQYVAACLFVGVNAWLIFTLAWRAPGGMLAEPAMQLLALKDAPEAPHRSPAVYAGLFVLLVTLIFSLAVFEGGPRQAGEVDYLFQAKIFASHTLYAPAPPLAVREHLGQDFIGQFDGRWFTVLAPGWPAVLAIGVKLGVPWLINPLLSAAAIWLAYGLVLNLYDRGTANLAILLLATSPWLLAMGGSLLSQSCALMLMISSWRALSLMQKAWLQGALSGALMGGLVLVRPVDGLVVALATLGWSFFAMPAHGRWSRSLAFCSACLLLSALIFAYDDALLGDPLLTPTTQYLSAIVGGAPRPFEVAAHGGRASLNQFLQLFHVLRQLPDRTPAELANALQFKAVAANRELYGWPIGSLALIAIHAAWGRWNKVDLAMAGLCAALITAHLVYRLDGGVQIGPHDWFLCLAPLTLLSARGAQTLVEIWLQRDRRSLGKAAGGFLAMELLAVSVFLPWRATTKYFELGGYHGDFVAMAKAHDLKGSLVFVRSGGRADFASAFTLNQPDLSAAGPVFLLDLGERANHAAAAAFPGRPVLYACGRLEGRPARLLGPERPTLDDCRR